ncbi:MAG TPA: TonB family protein [Bryobacteraceae bacterium]|nr:TonB family protein [Bryobacteraceae bacterium]
MFEQSFVGTGKTRRPWTVVVAFGGQVVVIAALLAIPLLFVQSLPMAQLADSILLAPPPPPPPPPPPAPSVHVAKAIRTAPRKLDLSQLIAPRTIPKQVVAINDIHELPPPSEVAGVVGGVPGGLPGGVVGGVIGGLPSAVPPPPPPKAEPPQPATPARVRIGGNVQAAKLIREVQPLYPVLARDARIAGTVRLQAIISKTGHVEDLKLVSGQPLLVDAAMDAVRQWVYKPTYLNGTPVEVVTEVDVNFHLST